MKSLDFYHEQPKQRREERRKDKEKKRIIALTYEKGDHKRMFKKKGIDNV